MDERERDQEREELNHDEPREGTSPARAPREDQPEPEEADITPAEWHQVPNADGQGGVSWEELRKGQAPPPESETAESRLWDDRHASERQEVDSPEDSWQLPDPRRKRKASHNW
jgi:hypothetical protein